jgi:hypothetical protein
MIPFPRGAPAQMHKSTYILYHLTADLYSTGALKILWEGDAPFYWTEKTEIGFGEAGVHKTETSL